MCWEFPPKRSIGGRRWAKLAKSFVKLNYKVSVISNMPSSRHEPFHWISTEIYSKIKTYNCDENFLVKWLNDYSSPLRKIKVRVAKFFLEVCFKGTIYDRTIGVENAFCTLAKKVIEKDNINIVFVTGAPFNLLYYTAMLREQFKSIKIICDYRDPWIKAQNYGMKELTEKRRSYELQKQNYVFEKVDIVTAPNGFLLQEIKETYTGKERKVAKFIELQHAFDPDDVITNRKVENKKIKIVYAGALYLGSDIYLKLINDSIDHIKQNAPDFLPEITIYTNDMDKKDVFTRNSDTIKISNLIGEKIFEEVSKADYIIILLAEHNKNYLTSKFFEFLPYKKPYIYIGPMGFVSQKIEKEKFGFCLMDKTDLLKILSTQSNEKMISDGLINENTFDSITKEFLKKIDFESFVNEYA